MRLLIDTNVLLRFANPDDPSHSLIVASIDRLLTNGNEIGLTPQACRELWSVATRPKEVNGFGLEPSFVDGLLSDLKTTFAFWDDAPGIFAEWRRLVTSLNIRGIQTHDANHAAAAIVHGATHVLTLDRKDFDRYRRYGLEPLRPEDVTAS